VAEYYALPQPVPFDVGDLHTTIDTRKMEYGVLVRADALVLRMIQDSWQSRPIYFARSAAGYPRTLGLGDNVLTQGLASKLFVPPSSAAQSKDTLYVQGDGWFDVARTDTLWNDVFRGQESIIGEGQWIDRASVSMPALYLFAGAELADALRVTGKAKEASRVLATTNQVAHATGLDGLVRGIEDSVQQPARGDSTGVTLRGIAGSQPRTQSTEPTTAKPPIRKPSP
jgi:hypothetical protein